MLFLVAIIFCVSGAKVVDVWREEVSLLSPRAQIGLSMLTRSTQHLIEELTDEEMEENLARKLLTTGKYLGLMETIESRELIKSNMEVSKIIDVEAAIVKLYPISARRISEVLMLGRILATTRAHMDKLELEQLYREAESTRTKLTNMVFPDILEVYQSRIDELNLCTLNYNRGVSVEQLDIVSCVLSNTDWMRKFTHSNYDRTADSALSFCLNQNDDHSLKECVTRCKEFVLPDEPEDIDVLGVEGMIGVVINSCLRT